MLSTRNSLLRISQQVTPRVVTAASSSNSNPSLLWGCHHQQHPGQNNTQQQYTAWQPTATAIHGSSSSIGQYRAVHSKRQIRLRFKGPRRARLDVREGIDRTPQPPPAVEFPPVYTPERILHNGWSAPPPPTFELPKYPFTILRTKNKPHGAAGFLPVYTDYRKDGTKVSTIIRKIRGDVPRFVQELRAVLEIPIPKNPKEDPVRIRAGSVEIPGHRVQEVRMWLIGLGF